jgi:pimeloyl-ACP methyl ester carboxylesterase
MAYATVNGIKLHYEVYGQGDPILMINGLSIPAVAWVFQVRDLSPHYQVITFDNRGVGETGVVEGEVYTIAQMADDAAGLLDHLGVKRAHVIGTSMGGTIVQELAIRHPKRVRSLVLGATWVKADSRFLYVIESWMRLAQRMTPEERFRDVLAPWAYSPRLFERPGAVEEVLKRTLAYPFQTKPEGIERQGRGLLGWHGSRAKEVRKIRVPALVLVGRDDILTPPAFSRELARLIPKARLKILPGGHGFFAEEPEAVNRAILAFLKGVK